MMNETEIKRVVEDIKSELREDFKVAGLNVKDEILAEAVGDTFDYDDICNYAKDPNTRYLLTIKLEAINKVFKHDIKDIVKECRA